MPYTYFRYRYILGDIYKTAACNVEVVERHKNAYTYVYCVCLHNCGLLSHFKMIFFFHVCMYIPRYIPSSYVPCKNYYCSSTLKSVRRWWCTSPLKYFLLHNFTSFFSSRKKFLRAYSLTKLTNF